MIDSNLINQILASQLTDQKRRSMLSKHSNDILENDGSEDAFQEKIESLYKKLVNQ
jgi:dephospho-CoA kinase